MFFGEGNNLKEAYEVERCTRIWPGLVRLSNASIVYNNPSFYIVADKGMEKEYERILQQPCFYSIKEKCKFLSFDEVDKLWKRYVGRGIERRPGFPIC